MDTSAGMQVKVTGCVTPVIPYMAILASRSLTPSMQDK